MDNPVRPYIICHMMSTIDGKITSGTAVDILEEYFSLYTKTEDQLGGQAWMCGRKTMEMFAQSIATPLPNPTKEIGNDNFIVPLKNVAFMIAVDTKGAKTPVTLDLVAQLFYPRIDGD